MEKRYWFAAKRYGWGWGLPIAWQGWIVLALFVILMIAGAYLLRPTYGRAAFIAYVTVLTAGLVAICAWKGEPPGWRWGGNDR